MTEMYIILLVLAIIIVWVVVREQINKKEENILNQTPSTKKIFITYEKALRNINNENPDSYLLRNNYCKYDMLIFSAFYAKLFSPSEDGLHFFFEEELNSISEYAIRRLKIPDDDASEMLHNRIQLYTNIINNNEDEDAIESFIFEITQLLKYDIEYCCYVSYDSTSPIIIGGITEEFMITVQVKSFSKIFLQNYISL